MTLLTIPVILMLLGGGASTARDAAAGTARSGSCPAETEQGRRVVVRYATSDEYRPVRERSGVPELSQGSLRLLVDDADGAVCQRITATIQRRQQGGTAGFRPVYYAAGDHYLVALSRERPDPRPAPAGHVSVSLGRWAPLYVMDQDFNIVASAAM